MAKVAGRRCISTLTRRKPLMPGPNIAPGAQRDLVRQILSVRSAAELAARHAARMPSAPTIPVTPLTQPSSLASVAGPFGGLPPRVVVPPPLPPQPPGLAGPFGQRSPFALTSLAAGRPNIAGGVPAVPVAPRPHLRRGGNYAWTADIVRSVGRKHQLGRGATRGSGGSGRPCQCSTRSSTNNAWVLGDVPEP